MTDALDLSGFARLAARDHGLCVVSTTRADGTVQSSLVNAGVPDDPAAGVDAEGLRVLLRAVFTAAGGTHDDWPAFDRVMRDERRAAVLVHPTRAYSNA